jgi:CheY-like chemotaxis protein
MEALGRLAGGIAHDFNNVLMAIAGFNDLISAELGPNHPSHSDIVEIRAASDRAAGLIRQLLTFSRRRVVKREAIAPGEVVRALVPMLERLLGEDVELVLAIADDAGTVQADRNQLEQVVVNLAVNARDAMPLGGRLAIDIAATQLDAEFARSQLSLEPGPHVVVAVSDTGDGIDAETQRHIFEPFFTTKSLEQGTGLGLSTVFGIVQQSGGSISVYSEPGHGTTIKVYLPRTEGVPTAEPRRAEPSRPGPDEVTILVVDDEAAVRRVVTRLLERAGHTVLAAADGAEALAIAQAHAGRIDLLLTDVVLPGMPGRDVADQLRGQRPQTRVLYMSGYPGDEITRRGLEADATYVEKPFSADTLADAVDQALAAEG